MFFGGGDLSEKPSPGETVVRALLIRVRKILVLWEGHFSIVILMRREAINNQLTVQVDEPVTIATVIRGRK